MGRKRQRTTLGRDARVFTRALGNIPIAGKFIRPIGEAASTLTGTLLATAGKLTDAELMATGHLAKKGLSVGIPARSKTRRRHRRRGKGTRKKRKRRRGPRKKRRRGTRKGRRRKRAPAGARLAYDAVPRRSRRRRRHRRRK